MTSTGKKQKTRHKTFKNQPVYFGKKKFFFGSTGSRPAEPEWGRLGPEPAGAALWGEQGQQNSRMDTE
jgi:hypothetical protein